MKYRIHDSRATIQWLVGRTSLWPFVTFAMGSPQSNVIQDAIEHHFPAATRTHRLVRHQFYSVYLHECRFVWYISNEGWFTVIILYYFGFFCRLLQEETYAIFVPQGLSTIVSYDSVPVIMPHSQLEVERPAVTGSHRRRKQLKEATYQLRFVVAFTQ